MASFLVKILVLSIFGVTVKGVFGSDIQLNKLDFTKSDAFGDIKSEIKPSGNGSSLSLTLPLKQELDDQYQLKINLLYNNMPLLVDHVIPLCDALTDMFLQPIFSKVESSDAPEGKAPTSCPIPAATYSVNDLVLETKDYIPMLPIPSGDFQVTFEVSQADSEPILTAVASGTVVPNMDWSFPSS